MGVHFSVMGVLSLFLASFFQNPLPRSMWWCSMRLRVMFMHWVIVPGAGGFVLSSVCVKR